MSSSPSVSNKPVGTTRVGIAGAGAPGIAHAQGIAQSGGMKVVAVADLIPARRDHLVSLAPGARSCSDAMELVQDAGVDLISICLPTHLHAPVALAALKAGKHVVIEPPPGLSVKEAKQIDSAAVKYGKVVVYAMQRRFGAGEQATRQALEKGYAGDIKHARVAWMRTRGVPGGTGWYTDRTRSGGGALIDLGTHMLDLAWYLMGSPAPLTVFAKSHAQFTPVQQSPAPDAPVNPVEDSAFALIGFEGGRTLELSCAWAFNQPPQQEGVVCRLYGTSGAVDVYTPQGAVLYRNLDSKTTTSVTPLKPPKTVHHAALMRHVRECIIGKATPAPGAHDGLMLMQMIEAMYRSIETGKSADVKGVKSR